MKSKVLNDRPERTIALIPERGDEVMSTLQRFAVEERKDYQRIPVDEQVEVLSLRRVCDPISGIALIRIDP